jgi:hypothetical protein
MNEWTKLAFTFLGGGLIGSVFTWLINKRQHRDARLREFLRFLHGWRADIESAAPSGPDPVVIMAYDAKRSEFAALAGIASDLFTDAEKFKRLTEAVSTIKEVQNSTTVRNPFKEADRGKSYVLSALDALITFVKTG